MGTRARLREERPDVTNAAKGSDVGCHWQWRQRLLAIVARLCMILTECLPWHCHGQWRARLSTEFADIG